MNNSIKPGKRYLFTSGTSGYVPNPSKVCMFDDPHGDYVDLGDPCIGDTSGTTFSSQITSVIQLSGTDTYIACADRWMPQFYVMPTARIAHRITERHFRDYMPDLSPHTAEKQPMVEQRHSENTSVSRYVWLPIEWKGDKPIIRWRSEWRIEDV